MKGKKILLLVGMMAALLVMAGIGLAAGDPTQTAQSAMVKLDLDQDTYQIEGTTTWTFNRGSVANPGCAMNAYTNAWDGNPPVVTTGTSTDPGPVAAPAPEMNQLQNHAQAERCTFFCGGDLTSTSYTQTVNQTRGWKRTFTYNITPKVTTVAARTCWSSVTEGDGFVDIGFTGFISSESYMAQTGKKTKYSFTLSDSLGGSRVQNAAAQLQKSDGLGGWDNIGDPINFGDPITGILPFTATTEDYGYYGNAGVFGKSTGVYSQLHAPPPGGKPETLVSAILLEDSFANNDNDLATGNVHQANFEGEFPGISEAGDYRIMVTGTVKGNDASAPLTFSVSSELIVIGGCACP